MRNIIIILFLAISSMLSAQVEKGAVTIEIVDIASDNPQVAAMAESIKGSKTYIYFDADKSISKMDMMGGMVKVATKVDEQQTMDMTIDAMGQKIWVQATELEQKKVKAENDNPLDFKEISYDKEDKKTIKGYECYKMNIAFPDADGASIEAYITEQIKCNATLLQGVLDLREYEGFPLEIKFTNSGVTTTIEAVSVENTLDESVFEMNTSGYQQMTLQELIDMTKGMGMGF